MSTSKIATSRHGRLLHSALAAAALMACSLVAQAADPVPAVNAAVGAKTMSNGKASVDVNGVPEVKANADANAKATAKTDMNGKKMEKAVSDTWITTKVKSELFADSATKGVKVHVTTMRGVVMLKGKLSSQDAVDQVKTIAASVKGVNSVDVSGLVVAGS